MTWPPRTRTAYPFEVNQSTAYPFGAALALAETRPALCTFGYTGGLADCQRSLGRDRAAELCSRAQVAGSRRSAGHPSGVPCGLDRSRRRLRPVFVYWALPSHLQEEVSPSLCILGVADSLQVAWWRLHPVVARCSGFGPDPRVHRRVFRPPQRRKKSRSYRNRRFENLQNIQMRTK